MEDNGGVASHRDGPGFGRMMELAVAPLLANLRPSFALDHANCVPDRHWNQCICYWKLGRDLTITAVSMLTRTTWPTRRRI